MQKGVIILAVIGIIIMALLLLRYTNYLPETPGKAYEQAARIAAEYQCTDSDAGKNLHDYGYTIELVNGQNIKNADTCAGSILYEAVCLQGEVKAIEKIDCQDYDMICTNGACAISASTIDEQQCIDSDDGLNMMEFGFTTEFRNGRQITNDDKCSGNTLFEAVCKQGITKAAERVNCGDYGMICSDGVCIQEEDAGAAGGDEDDGAGPGLGGQGQGNGAQGTTCTDSDNGINDAVAGRVLLTTNGLATSWPDACSAGSPDTLLEQYCPSADARGVRQIDCTVQGQVCSDGACVAGAGAAGGARGAGGLNIPRDIGNLGADRLGNLDELARRLGGAGRAGAQGPTCTDSDNGNRPETAGTTTVVENGMSTVQMDGCRGNILLEKICDVNRHATVEVDCAAQGKTCAGGKCAPFQRGAPATTCTDSDGNDAGRKGTVTVSNGDRQTDMCSDAGAVTEFTCTNSGTWLAHVVNCEANEICRDGACVTRPENAQPPAQCTDTDGNNPDVMGRLVLADGNDFLDVCHFDNILLTEQYCGGGNAQGTVGTTRRVATIDCSASGRVCRDSACVAENQAYAQQARLCVDNDGDDPYTAGRVNVIVGTEVRNEIDTCLNTDALREHICGPNNVHGVKTYYCSNTGYTCKDGKCVDLRVSRIQQTLQPAGQAIQPPTVIRQYPILQNTIIRNLI